MENTKQDNININENIETKNNVDTNVDTNVEDTKENDLNAREKALEEKEKALKEKEIEWKLKEQGLSKELAKYINFADVEDVDKYITEVKKVVQAQQSYIPKEHKSANTSVTKEQFKNMNYAERVNLYNTNPTLYKALTK